MAEGGRLIRCCVSPEAADALLAIQELSGWSQREVVEAALLAYAGRV
jgi:hypothetical protein